MPTATERRPPISRRELGRATLARQLLLERAPVSAVEAVALLAGMQAQEPRPPFLGLWSRLRDFQPDELLEALRGGAVLRGPLFRATLHLVTEADWSVFRGPCQPALSRAARVLRERIGTIDVARASGGRARAAARASANGRRAARPAARRVSGRGRACARLRGAHARAAGRGPRRGSLVLPARRPAAAGRADRHRRGRGRAGAPLPRRLRSGERRRRPGVVGRAGPAGDV